MKAAPSPSKKGAPGKKRPRRNVLKVMAREPSALRALAKKIRSEIAAFSEQASFEDSVLVLDGTGLNCANLLVFLSILGEERLKRFKEVHVFSGGSICLFYLLAAREGVLDATRTKLKKFNRRNQRAHGVLHPLFLGRYFAKRAVRKRAPTLPSVTVEWPLRYLIHPNFLERPASSFSDRLNFWTYARGEKRFVAISANSPRADWKPTEVVRALVAVPGIYAPFERAGERYSDAMFAPGIREHFKTLRARGEHCLFASLARGGVEGNTRFVKLHRNGTAKQRLLGDAMRFFGGVANAEFDLAFRWGLGRLKGRGLDLVSHEA